MKYIKLTKLQADDIRGRHGRYSEIQPIEYNGSYLIPYEVLSDSDLIGVREKIISYNGEIIEREMTAEEIAQMEAIEAAEPSNEQIRAMREQAYKERSDSLYLAWQKYLATGDDRAEQARQMWLEEVAKIDKEFPYNEL